jgi:hypothetical protein
MNINNKLFIFLAKTLSLILISSIASFYIFPAFAEQTTCTNYWVNPNTGKTECFGQNSNTNFGVTIPNNSRSTDTNLISLEKAFAERKSNIQVKDQGKVIKLLTDDLEGGKHQRFLIQLVSGQTLLVAHNIDLAPRISSLQAGDLVSFYGEYEWNSKGGVIHWTHRDPNDRHIGGWIEHRGKVYQ